MGEGKFGFNPLLSTCLRPSNQQLMTEAPYFDRALFWMTVDLENKLLEFRDYFNSHRTHHSLAGRTPDQDTKRPRPFANLNSYRWQSHCRGLYQTSIAA
jgi:hypothetical protein